MVEKVEVERLGFWIIEAAAATLAGTEVEALVDRLLARRGVVEGL
jgi:hypothetical protein